MRRSLLFIPANNPGMLQNADVFEADAVIFDLEDAVHITEKDASRDLLASFLKLVKLDQIEIIVRVNEISDLDEVINEKINTILLPEATLETLVLLDKKLTVLEKKYKFKKEIGVIALIESPDSVMNVYQISKQPRVNGLLLGAEDLSTYLGVKRTLEAREIEFARSMVIFAAKASHIDAIDTPFTDTNDLDSLKKDVISGKSLGMTAKACIHPNQIDTVNRLFLPSAEEIEHAKKILLAKEIADRDGLGAFSVDGKMVDKPIIARAQKIIENSKGMMK